MLKSLLISLFAVAVATTGCTREATITGDVFIVTKGGPSIKLGLVEVRLVPEASAAAKLAAVISEAKEKTKLLNGELSTKASLARIGAIGANVDLTEHWDDVARRARALDAGFYRKVMTQRQEYLEARKQGLEKRRAELEDLKRAEMDLQAHASGYALVPSLPASEFTARTDADGKFTVTVPRGRYVALAAAKREVGSAPEFYAWAVRVDLDGQPALRLMLSNDNLVEASCEQCALRAADFMVDSEKK